MGEKTAMPEANPGESTGDGGDRRPATPRTDAFAPPQVEGATPAAARSRRLDDENAFAKAHRRQQKQIELLRSKVFALQQVLIRANPLDLTEFGGPLSELSPIEIKRVANPTDGWLVVFGGMNTSLSMPSTEFFNTIDRLDLPMNVVYVKDFWQCWYQKGLLGLTKDVPDTARYLRDLAGEGARIATLGTSSGAFAAILFGVLLGADRAIAFGPQTRVDESIYARFKATDSRLSDLALDSPFMDLRSVLQTHAFSGTIEVHYGGRNRVDKAEAMHLSGIPSVELHEHDTTLHPVARMLRDEGRLDAVLARLGRPATIEP